MKFDKILICGTNWLGDSIISMPAVQLFKEEYPTVSVSMLVKTTLKDIWGMHSAIDEVITYSPDKKGTFEIAALLRRQDFDKAYIFPNSFRAAFIPYIAKIKQRRGMVGKWRSLMLTDIVKSYSKGKRHQVYEYVKILDVTKDFTNPVPELTVTAEVTELIKKRFLLKNGNRYAAIIPGAARGDSKRWPTEYFAEIGQYLIKQGIELLILGSPGESKLCQMVADSCGNLAVNLAGKTSLPDFAAVLSLCELTVCNDSGGMHLASAVGSNVVAIFGLTDPVKTGPLGNNSKVVAAEGFEVSRDISRSSKRATECLRSIKPEKVKEEIESVLRV